jgi:putative hydrolase of the HAD superfamily
MNKPIFLFDMSGVLINTNLDKLKAKVSETSRLPLNQINNFWKNDKYIESELGKISSKEYYEFYSHKIGLSWTYESWINEWSNIFSYNKNGFKLFNYLIKKDYDVYILSNLAEYHKIAVEHKFSGFWNLSKANFLSYEMNLLKPDPEIYNSVCRQLKKLPKDIFYIDDVLENVSSAINIGINSFHFLDNEFDTVLQWMRNKGVEVN